jgi:hypothetical protein
MAIEEAGYGPAVERIVDDPSLPAAEKRERLRELIAQIDRGEYSDDEDLPSGVRAS